MSRDADIDRLYQRPLDEFTPARNALAKGAGKDSGAIRALTKPPLAAWAVNQLYWQDRRTWDSLIDAAENLRRVNKAVLAGRSGDVRAAGAAHDAAVRDALKATLAQLATAGHPVTDATRQAIVNTLRALPAEETPGRLTRALQPGGFEMLAGMSVATKATKGTRDQEKQTTDSTKERAQSKEDARALTQAREAAAAADRALKDAEQAVRRHEFEIARAARDEERAGRALEQARAALGEAQRALATAERDQADVESRRSEAESAAKNAASAATGARRQAVAAHAALKKIQGR